MSHYLKIFQRYARNGLMSQLEYRFEVLAWSVNNMLWLLLAILSINLTFGQVKSIAGWSQNEVLLLVLTSSLFDSLLWIFVFPSLDRFVDLVYKGTMDFYLLKPVNIRFLVSTSQVEIDNTPRALVAIVLIVSVLNKLPGGLTLWPLLHFGLLLVIGLVIFYNLFFIVSTSSILFTNLFNMEDFFSTILDVGRFPVYIFNSGWRLLFVYLIPTAYIATFPVQALLGRASLSMVIFGAGLVVVSFAVSQWFWGFALRHYTSASS